MFELSFGANGEWQRWPCDLVHNRENIMSTKNIPKVPFTASHKLKIGENRGKL
jgi:hypothetical protein